MQALEVLFNQNVQRRAGVLDADLIAIDPRMGLGKRDGNADAAVFEARGNTRLRRRFN
jgi:hypothetical protein